MAHFSRLSKIVIDAPAPVHDQELSFWQGALGLQLDNFEKYPEFHGAEFSDDGFGLLIQRIDEGPSRIHLDIHTSDVEAETARLEALGAVRVRQVNRWWIMKDPAGLLFCVVPDPTLSETNSHRWD